MPIRMPGLAPLPQTTHLGAAALLAAVASGLLMPDIREPLLFGEESPECAKWPNAHPLGDIAYRIVVSDLQRRFVLHVPRVEQLPPGGLPLWILAPGTGQHAEDQILMADFRNEADTQGFAFLALEGEDTMLNIGMNAKEDPNRLDDVSYTKAAIEQARQDLCIDASRIYCTGYSRGARFCSRLVSELPGTIAAIAPVAGVVFPEPINATGPVPVIAFHGTEDPINPYGGHGDPEYWQDSVPLTMAKWAEYNGCTRSEDSEPVNDVHVRNYLGCKHDVVVKLVRIDGGGHTWPGSVGGPFASIKLGPVNLDISANQMMGDFFAGFSLSASGRIRSLFKDKSGKASRLEPVDMDSTDDEDRGSDFAGDSSLARDQDEDGDDSGTHLSDYVADAFGSPSAIGLNASSSFDSEMRKYAEEVEAELREKARRRQANASADAMLVEGQKHNGTVVSGDTKDSAERDPSGDKASSAEVARRADAAARTRKHDGETSSSRRRESGAAAATSANDDYDFASSILDAYGSEVEKSQARSNSLSAARDTPVADAEDNLDDEREDKIKAKAKAEASHAANASAKETSSSGAAVAKKPTPQNHTKAEAAAEAEEEAEADEEAENAIYAAIERVRNTLLRRRHALV
eukprot:TRINITY_DN37409_c0_g1_i1.p1 TRINITY_DN37409_c0_g1~~TRINITY_DN37409_c0_g1_i1.p1  ORF type:complete len:633 (-),score=140.44 TRINITY_DN37409_c0_g1_i1:203-2101(-)